MGLFEDNFQKKILPALCVLLTKYSSHEKLLIEYFNHDVDKSFNYQLNLFDIKNNTILNLMKVLEEYSTQSTTEENLEKDDVFRVLIEVGNRKKGKDCYLYNLVLQYDDIRNELSHFEFILDSSTYPIDILEQIRRHYLRSFEFLSLELNTKISDLDLLSVDKNTIVKEFNKTKHDWGVRIHQSYAELFEQQASITPHHIAIQHGSKVMTYMEVNNKANQISRILIQSGVSKGDFVPILMDRGFELIIVILALWKIGAVYVPLDPQYPSHRLIAIFENCNPKHIVTSYCEKIPLEYTKYQIDIYHIFQISDEYEATNLLNEILPDELSYMIYTSGTTGKPKGVMIEHQGMINHLLSKNSDLFISNESRVAQIASHCFDISIWQMFSPLIVGGSTVIYDFITVTTVGKFLKEITEDRITILEVVPSYLSVLLNWITRRADSSYMEKLTYLLVTGEILSGKLVQQWQERFPEIPIVNAYGPTEASDDITHYFIEQSNFMRVPIGKPIHNMEIFIVNDFRLCPVGVKGEIWVRGIGVGRGYLNEPQKTESAFVTADLLQDGCSTRFYRTGDIGCWNHDGEILYFGRKDGQIKYKGYRIETTEIDIALMECHGVMESVTLVKQGELDEKYLVSYIRPKISVHDIELMKKQIIERLPHYMIPSHIVSMDSFPLTDNGKVDRKKLTYIN